ncbi:MAG: hypothetical protein U1E31_00430 [Rickettsiales bacterium]
MNNIKDNKIEYGNILFNLYPNPNFNIININSNSIKSSNAKVKISILSILMLKPEFIDIEFFRFRINDL